jgi:hypothetical protein
VQHTPVQLLLLLLVWLPSKQHIQQHWTSSWQWHLHHWTEQRTAPAHDT